MFGDLGDRNCDAPGIFRVFHWIHSVHPGTARRGTGEGNCQDAPDKDAIAKKDVLTRLRDGLDQAKPARAANSSPMRSASLSCSRELGKASAASG